MAARAIGSTHIEAPVTPDLFNRRWLELVERGGLPLSTPNEVAINEVARRLRADGNVVTLSGEGADELFAGYEAPIMSVVQHLVSGSSRTDDDGGVFHLQANSWVGMEAQEKILSDAAWEAAGRGREVEAVYREAFLELGPSEPIGDDGLLETQLQRHLRFHRRINLENLLRRLDSATMLASVEGRTPFADVVVAGLAESLPMRAKFEPGSGGRPAKTKRGLRDAYQDRLPPEIVSRPKASFPLPFQTWMSQRSGVVLEAPVMRTWFKQDVLELVARAPESVWTISWPMINTAMWPRRWWG